MANRDFRRRLSQDRTVGVEEEGFGFGGAVSFKAELSPDDFGTLIIQLRALGLIEKSERNRSVKDAATYWTITPFGDKHLTTLRAIRRDVETETGTDD